MRIQQNHVKSSITAEQQVRHMSVSKESFGDFLDQSRSKRHEEALQKLFKDIDEQGQSLAEQRTIQHLVQYKKLVQQMIAEVIQHGLQLQEKKGYVQRRTKTYKIVQSIDQKLIDLTDEVMQSEQSSLNILAITGDIKGMLINLYT